MRRSFSYGAALASIFIAVLIANIRLAGTSPIIWIDTFNDETEVRQCLVDDACTLTGMQTSVSGQVHAVAWLEMRALLESLGVGFDGTHLTMLLLNAAAAVLIFVLATRLGGRLAGAIAVLVFLDHLDTLIRITALYNTSILLFLGAALLLACTAVTFRPNVVSVTLAALLAAVMANVHLACVLTGASVVWVAFAARRSLRLAAFGAAVFALAAFAIAPPTWLHNLNSVLQNPGGARHPAAIMTMSVDPLRNWALLVIGCWALSFVICHRSVIEYRQRLQGAIAVLIPFLAAFVLASRLGLHAEAKYLAHLQAAWAVAAAVPIAAAVRALLRRLTPTTALRGIEGIAPFVVSLLLILPGDVGARTHSTNSADERSPRIRDLETVVRVLHDEQGWDVSHILEHLKTPYGVSLLSGVPLMPVSGGDTPSAAGSDGGSAMLVMFETSDLPEPMPSNWRIVSRSKRFTTVLILMQSRFDWHDFEVCLQPADGSETHCATSDMHADDAARIVVPNMPQPGSGWLGTLKLSFHLRASADPSGAEIFMPRIPMLCAGRIASPSDGALQVDPDGRHATVAVPPLGRDGVPPIAIEWRVGSPDCDVLSFDSLPPFFVEGEAATVRPVAATFRKAE